MHESRQQDQPRPGKGPIMQRKKPRACAACMQKHVCWYIVTDLPSRPWCAIDAARRKLWLATLPDPLLALLLEEALRTAHTVPTREAEDSPPRLLPVPGWQP